MQRENGWPQRHQIGLLLLIAAIGIGLGMTLFFSLLLLMAGLLCFVAGMVLLAAPQKSLLKELLREKRRLIEQISKAEQKCLNREMAEEAFQAFTAQKQRDLVQVESHIAALQEKKRAENAESLQGVAARKKHILKQLLQKKKALLSELEISEQKYLNRELKEETFFSLQHAIQASLLELDSKINGLMEDEDIQGVMKELRQKLRESEPSRSIRRHALSKDEQMISDLLEQTKPQKKRSER